jgi:hypothetical protein
MENYSAAETTTAEMNMMVRMRNSLTAASLAEMKAASLVEEMADEMVMMMDSLSAASLAEKTADMKVKMMDCWWASSLV